VTRLPSAIYYIVQFAKENPQKLDLPAVKLGQNEEVTEEAVWNSLKRAVSRVCNLQAHDGHWPVDYAGPLFVLPGLVHLFELVLLHTSTHTLLFLLPRATKMHAYM